MATVNTQGTHVFAVINDAVVRFVCPTSISMGEDSFSKIDITCLDATTKNYTRGLRDPGEGSIGINLDDAEASHEALIDLADSGAKVMWYVGSSHSATPPTYEVLTGVTLPTTRTWWSFEGYLNPAVPQVEQDSVIKYEFTIVRTSAVTTTKRTVTP